MSCEIGVNRHQTPDGQMDTGWTDEQWMEGQIDNLETLCSLHSVVGRGIKKLKVAAIVPLLHCFNSIIGLLYFQATLVLFHYECLRRLQRSF